MSKQIKIFSSPDGRYTVHVSRKIESDLVKEIALAKSFETGGIMIGAYNTSRDCAIINTVTGPPDDSKAGRSWFYRGLRGLQELIHLNWKKNQYYLGEWHLHPFASANPSTTDIGQMIKISRDKEYQCPEPLLLIIGGSKEAYEIKVFVFFAHGGFTELKAQ